MSSPWMGSLPEDERKGWRLPPGRACARHQDEPPLLLSGGDGIFKSDPWGACTNASKIHGFSSRSRSRSAADTSARGRKRNRVSRITRSPGILCLPVHHSGEGQSGAPGGKGVLLPARRLARQAAQAASHSGSGAGGLDTTSGPWVDGFSPRGRGTGPSPRAPKDAGAGLFRRWSASSCRQDRRRERSSGPRAWAGRTQGRPCSSPNVNPAASRRATRAAITGIPDRRFPWARSGQEDNPEKILGKQPSQPSRRPNPRQH